MSDEVFYTGKKVSLEFTVFDCDNDDPTAVVDFSTIAQRYVQIRDPKGIVRVAQGITSLVTDGTDGKIRYDSQNDLLAVSGAWEAMPWWVDALGERWVGSPKRFKVKRGLI